MDYGLDVNTATTAFSKYNTVFLEHRTLKIEVHLMPVDINAGLTIAFITDRDAGVPTILDSEEIGNATISNNGQRPTVLTWVPKSPDDSDFVLYGTTSTKAYLNLYTDNANLGSPIAATALWVVRPRFLIQFRGLSST